MNKIKYYFFLIIEQLEISSIILQHLHEHFLYIYILTRRE